MYRLPEFKGSDISILINGFPLRPYQGSEANIFLESRVIATYFNKFIKFEVINVDITMKLGLQIKNKILHTLNMDVGEGKR